MNSSSTGQRGHFIGGKETGTGTRLEIRLPYDGQVVATVNGDGVSLLPEAVEAAKDGARAMRSMSNGERSDLLFRLRDKVAASAGALAEAVMQETGKPIREARFEVERAQNTLLESAIAARHLSGEIIPIDAAASGKGHLAITLREPVGIIGAITPFNVPLNLALHKIGPALAAGNAVIHKPSENTPLSALLLARLAAEAGAPAGAYNVLCGGEDLGKAMVADPAIAMLTFTGSAPVGKAIRAAAGLKKVTLELGGNSGVIIDAAAAVSEAVKACVTGSFSNSGQVCLSIQRIFVQRALHKTFVDQFVAETRKLAVGHPADEATEVSSLIDEGEAERVREWIADAVRCGAKLLTGGERRGATVTPAVLEGLPDAARMAKEEMFGPAVAIQPFDEDADAIARVNSTVYGLQHAVFTNDLRRGIELAKQIDAGGVLINEIPGFRADQMPYGGVKESGLGREGPRYAIEEMTNMKLICWRQSIG